MTIGAVNPGHTMVVPIQHSDGLADLDPEIGGQMFRLAMRVAAAIRVSGLRCDGIDLFLADGRAAFQSVFHTHLHVFPRWRGDGFHLVMPPTFTPLLPRHELDDAAAMIEAALSLVP